MTTLLRSKFGMAFTYNSEPSCRACGNKVENDLSTPCATCGNGTFNTVTLKVN